LGRLGFAALGPGEDEDANEEKEFGAHAQRIIGLEGLSAGDGGKGTNGKDVIEQREQPAAG
jgi:hypothetical protein